jgi:hypothetical protein
MTASHESNLLTPKECAAYRRCSVRKLDRERADGRGCRYVRIDGRVFYRRQDVDRFIAEHVRGPHDADLKRWAERLPAIEVKSSEPTNTNREPRR